MSRAYDWGLKHVPELDHEQQVRRSLLHLAAKYRPGGYGRRYYFPETEEGYKTIYDPIVAKADEGDADWADRLISENLKKGANLYHGSPKLLDTLEPRTDHGDPGIGPSVFATPHKAMALAYLGRWADRDINQGGYGRDDWYLQEMRPGAFDDTYKGRTGWLYELPSRAFKGHKSSMGSDFEVISDRPVSPVVKTEVKDILKALEEAGVKLIPYSSGSKEHKAAVKRMRARLAKRDIAGRRGYLDWVGETNPELSTLLAGGLKKGAREEPKVRALSRKEFFPLAQALKNEMDDLLGEKDVNDEEAFKKWLSKYRKGLRIQGIGGEAAIATNPADGVNSLIINSLYTKPEARGKGYAQQLIAAAIARAKDEGYENIRLGTPKKNKAAKQFYLNRGFKLVDNKEYPEAYAFDLPVELGNLAAKNAIVSNIV